MSDFALEIDSYLKSEEICNIFLKLNLGSNRSDSLIAYYEKLYELSIVNRKEIVLVEKWLTAISTYLD